MIQGLFVAVVLLLSTSFIFAEDLKSITDSKDLRVRQVFPSYRIDYNPEEVLEEVRKEVESAEHSDHEGEELEEEKESTPVPVQFL